jgi:signal transduction histidine kinase
MLLQPELLHLCQSTIEKIQAVLTARHVSIQRSIAGGWRSLTADMPEYGDISGDLSDSVGQRLHALEVVYFKIATRVGPIKVAGDCLLLPIACHQKLWGRVCIINTPQAWQPHDMNWVIAISQLLGQAISLQERSANELVQIPTDLDLEEPLVLETSPASYDQAHLEQQIAVLIEQDQIKDEFISKISHDLRAPLMNMRMALKMFNIGTSRDPAAAAVIAHEKYSKYLNILEAECEREISLINNVLDLQKLETGNVSLELQSIDLVDWLPTIVETFQHRISARHQQLELLLPDRPATILIDEAALQRILSELLNNACKYTANQESIRCELEYPVNYSQPIYLVVSNVADIAPADLPLIFERFYRVPSADHHKQGGTGLGLSLVRSLVEQLHGQIVVQSSNGWTSFTVALPVQPPVAL